MKSLRLIMLLVLTVGVVTAPSQAAPECELFLLSGPGAGPHDDPAFVGCSPNIPGGPHDTSILMPGAVTAFGYVRGEAASRPPTRGVITMHDGYGAILGRTRVTFRSRQGEEPWPFGGRDYITNEFAEIPPAAMMVVIRARLDGVWHRHAYGRLSPPTATPRAVRSGTILAPDRADALGPMTGCRWTPDCLPWLTSCERPVAAGIGVSSSIVDVEELSVTGRSRTFEIIDQMPPIKDGMTVEFWDRDCRLIYGWSDVRMATFPIPKNAAWMTVVPGPGCSWLCFSLNGPALRWELR